MRVETKFRRSRIIKIIKSGKNFIVQASQSSKRYRAYNSIKELSNILKDVYREKFLTPECPMLRDRSAYDPLVSNTVRKPPTFGAAFYIQRLICLEISDEALLTHPHSFVSFTLITLLPENKT